MFELSRRGSSIRPVRIAFAASLFALSLTCGPKFALADETCCGLTADGIQDSALVAALSGGGRLLRTPL